MSPLPAEPFGFQCYLSLLYVSVKLLKTVLQNNSFGHLGSTGDRRL